MAMHRLTASLRPVLAAVSTYTPASATVATRGIRVRVRYPAQQGRAIQEFSRKVQAEGINKRIHETRYHEKRKTRRRVNAHNSVYYAQRNKMVRRYARLIATTQKAQWGVDI